MVKGLSPALRNRFTEIWVPSMEDFNDVSQIVESRLKYKQLTTAIVKFSEWFAKQFGGGHTNNGVISLRDILAWTEFINSCPDNLNPMAALYHGASMVSLMLWELIIRHTWLRMNQDYTLLSKNVLPSFHYLQIMI